MLWHHNTEHRRRCGTVLPPLLEHTYTTIGLLPMKILLREYEGTSHQSQRKVNEAAEVTLSSALLIAAFEARAETRTHDRFSLGLLR